MAVLMASVILCIGCVNGNQAIAQQKSASLPALVLAQDGKAQATIVIPDDADSWTKMAAGWVRDFAARSSGAEFPIVPESKAPQGTLIAFGHTKLAEKAGIATDNLKFDGCRMVVKGNVLYLLGRDVKGSYEAIPNPTREPWDYPKIIMQGDTAFTAIGAKGTCRAAAYFLEQVCGVRWLVPTSEGTYIPRMSRIALAADTDKTFEPFFMYHSNHCLYGDPRSEPAAYANNYRVSIKLYTGGGHTFARWVPVETYFKDHPEYFEMRSGVRSSTGNHVCASNTEARQIMLKNIQALFDAGYDLVQLGQSDGYACSPCECPDCRRLSNLTGARDADGELTIEYMGEPIYDFVRWAAEQCLDKYPGRYLHVLIYGPTLTPPKRFSVFPTNVVLEFASSGSPELIDRFDGYAPGGSTVYTPWYWVDYGIGFGLRFSYFEAADIMKYYRKKGIRGIHAGGGQMWGVQGPTYYIFGKLMGDPTVDYKALLKEYCDGLYGPASEAMQSFYERLHQSSDWPLFMSGSPMLTPEHFLAMYPPTRLAALNQSLKKAEAAAVTEREKNWVKMARDDFDYIRLATNALFMYRAWQVNPDDNNLTQLKASMDVFNQYRQRIVNYDPNYAQTYSPSHGHMCGMLTHGQSGSNYYADDWRELRKKVNPNDLSATDVGYGYAIMNKPFGLNFKSKEPEPTFHILYTPVAPKITGKMDDPLWQKTTPVTFKETEVRGLYDDSNLYIAFSCRDTSARGPYGVDILRDNPICYMDLVEFFVDPYDIVEANRFYHFLTGATPNAIQDLREGWEGLGSQDKTWSAPGFRYAFSKELGKGWYIEMVIPFKDIDAKAPAAGDVWLGNMSRQGGVLQQWSSAGSMSFCDPRSFGKFVFEKN